MIRNIGTLESYPVYCFLSAMMVEAKDGEEKGGREGRVTEKRNEVEL